MHALQLGLHQMYFFVPFVGAPFANHVLAPIVTTFILQLVIVASLEIFNTAQILERCRERHLSSCEMMFLTLYLKLPKDIFITLQASKKWFVLALIVLVICLISHASLHTFDVFLYLFKPLCCYNGLQQVMHFHGLVWILLFAHCVLNSYHPLEFSSK